MAALSCQTSEVRFSGDLDPLQQGRILRKPVICPSPSRIPHSGFLLLTVLTFGLSTGCRPEKKAVDLGSDVAATVAGHAISRKDFESALAAK